MMANIACRRKTGLALLLRPTRAVWLLLQIVKWREGR